MFKHQPGHLQSVRGRVHLSLQRHSIFLPTAKWGKKKKKASGREEKGFSLSITTGGLPSGAPLRSYRGSSLLMVLRVSSVGRSRALCSALASQLRYHTSGIWTEPAFRQGRLIKPQCLGAVSQLQASGKCSHPRSH